MVGAHPRTSCRRLFKKLEILTVPSQHIYSLMSFLLRIRKNFRLTCQCITLIQEINTIFADRLLTCRVFRKVHPTLASEFLAAYHEVLQVLKTEKTQFKVALKILECTLLLLCGWIFHMYRWYVLLTIWLCECILHCNICIVCMFMTCSTSYCLVTLKDLWIEYMYVCMYVCNTTIISVTLNDREQGFIYFPKCVSHLKILGSHSKFFVAYTNHYLSRYELELLGICTPLIRTLCLILKWQYILVQI